jgi:hypothetical protein
MEYSGNLRTTTFARPGYSMTPIQWHCMQTNAVLREIENNLSTPNNTKSTPTMHGPGGHGHDSGDEHQ